MSTLPHRPIVALDIDGTIAKYHRHFHWFAELYTGKELPLDWDPKFKGEFNRALHMSKSVYRDVKLAYRQGGMKRCMPVYMGTASLVRNVRKAGAEVWFCTTRPYLRLDNIDPDTRHFFRRNSLHYDGLLFGERKYYDLRSIVGRERVVAVVDDLPEQVASARKAGFPAFMRSGDHNMWAWDREDVMINDMQQAETTILRLVTEWKEENNNVR